jgi:hypothetical protein
VVHEQVMAALAVEVDDGTHPTHHRWPLHRDERLPGLSRARPALSPAIDSLRQAQGPPAGLIGAVVPVRLGGVAGS